MAIFEWINTNGWFVSIFALIFGAYLNSLFAKNKDNLMKIADKKGEYYFQYINVLHEFNKDFIQEDTNKRYLIFKHLCVLYGSSEVLNKMAVCEKNSINTSSEQGIQELTDLVMAMKKDIEKPKLTSRWYRKHKQNKLDSNIKDILYKYSKI
ncbi:hypothetical protein [Oceanobacillus picturae]|uniref:hypothetical protein n=1 Tax=Oceanobacillus picturae TaxID=171693 RepID=UPI000E678456|nr:hypothetical protein [Oceanobacillus picturae]RIU93437.1 hypothetical protein D1864_08200 [Oceanobacillus picturae]